MCTTYRELITYLHVLVLVLVVLEKCYRTLILGHRIFSQKRELMCGPVTRIAQIIS